MIRSIYGDSYINNISLFGVLRNRKVHFDFFAKEEEWYNTVQTKTP